MLHKIIVFEGPAGAGKSTLIKALKNEGLFVTPPSLAKIETPRNYNDPDRGAGRSLVKDYARIAELFSTPEPGPLMVLDRWGFSQLVYGAIRRGGFDPDLSRSVRGVISSLEVLSLTLSSDRIRRGLQPLDVSHAIRVCFVLPPLKDLKHRREAARVTDGRKFPFAAEEELRLYKEVKNLTPSTCLMEYGPDLLDELRTYAYQPTSYLP